MDREGMDMLLVGVVVDLYMVTEGEGDQLRHNTKHTAKQQKAIIGPHNLSRQLLVYRPLRKPLTLMGAYWMDGERMDMLLMAVVVDHLYMINRG